MPPWAAREYGISEPTVAPVTLVSELYVAAARQTALNLSTITYQTADADFQRILDSSTGAFHDDLSKRSQPFKDVVRQAQSVSSGTVSGAGLESLDGTQAHVLVAVTVKTSNAGKPEQETRNWRMRISVDKVGQSYKASNVEFVP
jgi:Mce-associated membrane protein